MKNIIKFGVIILVVVSVFSSVNQSNISTLKSSNYSPRDMISCV